MLVSTQLGLNFVGRCLGKLIDSLHISKDILMIHKNQNCQFDPLLQWFHLEVLQSGANLVDGMILEAAVMVLVQVILNTYCNVVRHILNVQGVKKPRRFMVYYML